MKSLSAILITLMAGYVLLSCNNEGEFNLSQHDQAALDGMRGSYQNAWDENEALKTALTANDTAACYEHDSLFHYHEDRFEEHHMEYSHGNNHDDHHHDSQGMHMMGNAGSMHHSGNDGHHHEDHEQMEELMHDHENIDHHFSN